MADILLYTPIYSYTAEAFVEKLLEIESEEDLTVLLNSPGGSVFAGWSMIGPLSERKGKVTFKVFGDASSMAFFSLLFADRVEALDVSTFMVHRADGYVDNEADQKFLDGINKSLRAKFEKRIDSEKFKEVTGYTFDDIFDPKRRVDVNLTAKEAKKIGLVDKIIKLEPKQLEAYTERFVAIADFNSHGSEGESPRGSGASENGESKKNSINQKSKKMTLEELKAAHPDLVVALKNEVIAQERERVGAYLAFQHIDAEAVKKGIEDGATPGPKFFAEMTLKGMSAERLNDEKEESTETVDASKKKEKTEEDEKAEAEKKEIAEAERIALEAAGINSEEE
jgi:ATP-dependent Clp protease protease subunit